MNWGKLLAGIGAGIAAPFTGGGSLAALPAIIGAGGAAMGAAGNSMASNRGNQAAFDLQSNDAFERALMARENDARLNRSADMKQALAGSALMGYKPAQRPAGMPQGFGGGAGPIGDEAAAFGASSALARLKQGDVLPALQKASIQDPGFWEKFLNIAGPAASVYGQAASRMGQPGGRPPIPGTNGGF